MSLAAHASRLCVRNGRKGLLRASASTRGIPPHPPPLLTCLVPWHPPHPMSIVRNTLNPCDALRYMIPVVMEPSCKRVADWDGPVAGLLANAMYVDLAQGAGPWDQQTIAPLAQRIRDLSGQSESFSGRSKPSATSELSPKSTTGELSPMRDACSGSAEESDEQCGAAVHVANASVRSCASTSVAEMKDSEPPLEREREPDPEAAGSQPSVDKRLAASVRSCASTSAEEMKDSEPEPPLEREREPDPEAAGSQPSVDKRLAASVRSCASTSAEEMKDSEPEPPLEREREPDPEVDERLAASPADSHREGSIVQFLGNNTPREAQQQLGQPKVPQQGHSYGRSPSRVHYHI